MSALRIFSYLPNPRIAKATIAAQRAYTSYLSRIERVHHRQLHRAGLAPIVSEGIAAEHPLASAHFGRLSAHEAFGSDLEPCLEAWRALNGFLGSGESAGGARDGETPASRFFVSGNYNRRHT